MYRWLTVIPLPPLSLVVLITDLFGGVVNLPSHDSCTDSDLEDPPATFHDVGPPVHSSDSDLEDPPAIAHDAGPPVHPDPPPVLVLPPAPDPVQPAPALPLRQSSRISQPPSWIRTGDYVT